MNPTTPAAPTETPPAAPAPLATLMVECPSAPAVFLALVHIAAVQRSVHIKTTRPRIRALTNLNRNTITKAMKALATAGLIAYSVQSKQGASARWYDAEIIWPLWVGPLGPNANSAIRAEPTDPKGVVKAQLSNSKARTIKAHSANPKARFESKGRLNRPKHLGRVVRPTLCTERGGQYAPAPAGAAVASDHPGELVAAGGDIGPTYRTSDLIEQMRAAGMLNGVPPHG